MLVLSRKKDASILIDGHIRITVVDIRGGQVRLGIDAPRNVNILRTEVAQRIAPASVANSPESAA